MRRLITPVGGAVWTLLSLMTTAACGEEAPPVERDASLPAVTVKAPAARQGQTSIGGFGAIPGGHPPMQAERFDQTALRDAQVQRLADLVKLDASTSDAYNTTGYWDAVSVRGFTLDNAYNYRREGLPINAETRLPLDNKAAVELLKGTSGIQAGISSPGGLLNLLVKRPEGRVRHATLGLTGGHGVLAAVDLSDRFGLDQQFGLRVNAAVERLAPDIDNAKGHRRLTALATDWVIAPGSVIEAEFEHSVHRQNSVPGFSLLGSSLPSADDIDPGRNLNQQPWTRPVVFKGHTGSLRWKQAWQQGWASTLTYGEQRLSTDDRAAFPFGCDDEGVYDRYCSDGRFDLYDYRSEGERRITRALDAQLTGKVTTGAVQHHLTLGWLRSVHTTDLNSAAFNYPPVSTGHIDGNFGPLPEDPSLQSLNTDRHERSTELYVRDAVRFSDQWQSWFGLRHTSLKRRSALTDGTRFPNADGKLTTPWVGLGYNWSPGAQLYASWGEGAELKSAPGIGYTNSGQALPAGKSRQFELGMRQQKGKHQWGLLVYHIDRPTADDVPADDFSKQFLPDGRAIHKGLEGQWLLRQDDWTLRASAALVDARRTGSATVSGKRPVNVPRHTLKLSGQYRWTSAAGSLPLTVQTDVVHEGPRWADRDNTVRLPSWTRVDLGLKTVQRIDASSVTWRLGVSNLFDQRAWRESPTLTGHIYLFPLAARTVTASAELDF